jgi:hypothetical protein
MKPAPSPEQLDRLHAKDSAALALRDLVRLQERFSRLARREPDPTNQEVLSSLFNEVEIGVAPNGINGFKHGGR